MPRWIAGPILGLFCAVVSGLAIMHWTEGGHWTEDARAEMLSTGVLSDESDQAQADPSGAQPVTPFTGLRPPDTKIANTRQAAPDPVVANVEGHPIYLSDLGDAIRSLPEALQKMPFEVIYPTLLDRMVDHEALVLMARARKLDEDPAVKRQVDAASARVLEGALLERAAVPQVTEAAIQERYARDFAGRPATEEVHARHILVSSEDEAKRLIGELNKGVDFATLARRFSKDPDNARGGDLGFFRHDQVWAGFADLAFSLKPGEVAQKPIFNEFGWHVVQVMERRSVPPPSLEQAHDAIRKELLQEAVRRVVAEAREGLEVHKFDMGGAPMNGPAGPPDAPVRGDEPAPSANEQPGTVVPAPAARPASALAPDRPGAPAKSGAQAKPGALQKPGATQKSGN
jgi:peptidyl-prolyl cis-trans isomerase C